MATPHKKPAKAPATPRKAAAPAKPQVKPAPAAKAEPAIPASNRNWKVIDTRGQTPEQAAQAIDQALQGKLAHKTVVKATKASLKSNNDAKVSSTEAKKGTSKRAAGTQNQPKSVKSTVKAAKKPATNTKPAGQRGAATTFTQAVADEICDRLSKGEPLAHICRSDNMPAVRTVSSWRAEFPQFAADFARAREEGFDFIAADTMTIIDTKPERCLTESGDKVDTGHVAWLKNRAEQRMKLLAKWYPTRYGDKIDVNHGGQEGNPVEVRTKVVVVPSKLTAEILSRTLTKDTDQ